MLQTEQAEALYGDLEPVALPWSECKTRFPATPDPSGDSWAITYWTPNRAIGNGIALAVTGNLESASHALIDATSTLRRRYVWWMNAFFGDGHQPGHLLPIVAHQRLTAVGIRERTTIAALTTLLAQRADCRARLAEPARVARLVDDLACGLLAVPYSREGVRRDTIDILVALQMAGLVHPLARPLSRGQTPPSEKVLERVRRRLEANPYRKGRRTPDDATIMRVARTVYLDVEPWPFSALVD